MKTLAELKKGDTCKIADFADNYTRCQTMRFGLFTGEEVKCIEKVGPIIIGKKQQRMAVGNSLAKKIYVSIE